MGKVIDLAVERAKREAQAIKDSYNKALKELLEEAKKIDWSDKKDKDDD